MILEMLDQHPTSETLTDAPNIKKVRGAIRKMKNNKAPSQSEFTTVMLKNLPEKGIKLMISTIAKYWTNENYQIKLWNIQKLCQLYKGKRDMQNLNNWRGICLKSQCQKMSAQ